MSLDLSELNLLKKIGSASEKIYAKKIYPLRAHGNLLLCSILLGKFFFYLHFKVLTLKLKNNRSDYYFIDFTNLELELNFRMSPFICVGLN